MKLKLKYRITFLLCNLFTRAESPVRLAIGKPDSPRFFFSEFTLKYMNSYKLRCIVSFIDF
ncbi:hypothetical protein [Leptospira noguchii]|uniref:hypothetical protein n=1 Tax=Leptospira noguchii TaxID=28182 RepID=UPI0009E3CF0F|nr:hypothetical protein [Leptospira noguchii]UOG52392.1 hypothetical protein MAL09_17755 [Leptospira noguchii]